MAASSAKLAEWLISATLIPASCAFRRPDAKARIRVTVSGKLSDTLPPGTLNSILRQAGLKR
jgi:hypothetical protein